jgi:hypothetical protein
MFPICIPIEIIMHATKYLNKSCIHVKSVQQWVINNHIIKSAREWSKEELTKYWGSEASFGRSPDRPVRSSDRPMSAKLLQSKLIPSASLFSVCYLHTKLQDSARIVRCRDIHKNIHGLDLTRLDTLLISFFFIYIHIYNYHFNT